jgi:hypothetical protein
MSASVLSQSSFAQRSVQRAFLARRPVNARVIKMAAQATVQLSQDELKKQARVMSMAACAEWRSTQLPLWAFRSRKGNQNAIG